MANKLLLSILFFLNASIISMQQSQNFLLSGQLALESEDIPNIIQKLESLIQLYTTKKSPEIMDLIKKILKHITVVAQRKNVRIDTFTRLRALITQEDAPDQQETIPQEIIEALEECITTRPPLPQKPHGAPKTPESTNLDPSDPWTRISSDDNSDNDYSFISSDSDK